MSFDLSDGAGRKLPSQAPLESFPFGMPVNPLEQANRDVARLFVLGVYASAVHARWVSEDGWIMVNALAVASEPEIFWCGEGAEDIIRSISLPAGSGRLVSAGEQFNGPSGRALDSCYLSRLGVDRSNSWLCDLIPLSRRNKGQTAALARAYDSKMDELKLPSYHWPPVPFELASKERRAAIEQEVHEASPEVLITLGDQPLKWFTKHFGSKSRLSSYGETQDEYGRLHPIQIAGRELQLLPLVHPRQAVGLGAHSSKWARLHKHWAENVAGSLLKPVAGKLRIPEITDC